MGRTIDLGTNRPLTRRVTSLVRTASADQLERGRSWYQQAMMDAFAIASDTGYALETVAGVIAALSPQTAWWQNLMLAKQAASAGVMLQGHTGDSMRKVNAILQGAEPLDVLGGLKVRSFYANIISGGLDAGVTIDRHAWDICTGLKGYAQSLSITPGRYAAASECYSRAAGILSDLDMTPAQLQATAWVIWRDAHGIRD